MNPAGIAAGGFLGTLFMTIVVRAASELRLTRMDLAFLLGTAMTPYRNRAKAIGFALHLVNGQLFAFVYYALFLAVDRSGWWLGALLGLGHGLFSGTVLVNVLLPLVHPRMGGALTSAPDIALLEPPGFLMLNYGPSTPVVMLLTHAVYGALVGGFASLG